jgi:hypothetical protein
MCLPGCPQLPKALLPMIPHFLQPPQVLKLLPNPNHRLYYLKEHRRFRLTSSHQFGTSR